VTASWKFSMLFSNLQGRGLGNQRQAFAHGRALNGLVNIPQSQLNVRNAVYTANLWLGKSDILQKELTFYHPMKGQNYCQAFIICVRTPSQKRARGTVNLEMRCLWRMILYRAVLTVCLWKRIGIQSTRLVHGRTCTCTGAHMFSVMSHGDDI